MASTSWGWSPHTSWLSISVLLGLWVRQECSRNIPAAPVHVLCPVARQDMGTWGMGNISGLRQAILCRVLQSLFPCGGTKGGWVLLRVPCKTAELPPLRAPEWVGRAEPHPLCLPGSLTSGFSEAARTAYSLYSVGICTPLLNGFFVGLLRLKLTFPLSEITFVPLPA